jgi:hypothetical protein
MARSTSSRRERRVDFADYSLGWAAFGKAGREIAVALTLEGSFLTRKKNSTIDGTRRSAAQQRKTKESYSGGTFECNGAAVKSGQADCA